jgi:hypothetical protein
VHVGLIFLFDTVGTGEVLNGYEGQELAQVGLLHADAVQFDPAQLGSGPAGALGHLLAGETRGLTEPP